MWKYMAIMCCSPFTPPTFFFFKRTCQTWNSDVIFQGEEILLANTTGSSKSKQLSYIPDKHTLVWTHCTWHSSSAKQIDIQPKHEYIIRKYCIPLLIFANCQHLLASHGEMNRHVVLRGTFSKWPPKWRILSEHASVYSQLLCKKSCLVQM